MQHLRVLSLRIGVTAALVLAALPAAGWKWGSSPRDRSHSH